MRKRIAAILLLGCMVMGSVVTPAQVSAAEVSETVTEAETEQTSEETSVNTAAAESTETAENTETAEKTETAENTESAEAVKAASAEEAESGTEAAVEEIVHPTGLMDLNVINVGSIAEDDVLDETEVNSSKSSSVYAAEWDAYSSNYVYNMLSTEEREFWDGKERGEFRAEFPFEVQNEKNKNDNWHSIVRYGAGTWKPYAGNGRGNGGRGIKSGRYAEFNGILSVRYQVRGRGDIQASGGRRKRYLQIPHCFADGRTAEFCL